MRSESFTDLKPAVTLFVLSPTSHDHKDWLEKRAIWKDSDIQKSTLKIWHSESNLNLEIGF